MSRTDYKKEYVDNFEEIESLYESGMSLPQIHRKLTLEGKLKTVPVRNFQNMHSTVKKDAIPVLRSVYSQKINHVSDFENARESIVELLREGLKTYEQVYSTLFQRKEIKMSYRFFRKLSSDHGLYRTGVLGDRSVFECEFLERKEEIIKNMEEGKAAKTVFDEMRKVGKLKMAFNTFRGYCLKHGVEMRLLPRGRKRKE